jgi:hypothetical protein
MPAVEHQAIPCDKIAGVRLFHSTGDRRARRSGSYLHRGTRQGLPPPDRWRCSVDALPKAVRIMAKVQLDTDLSDSDVEQIVTFLGSLTGSMPEGFGRAPVLRSAGFSPPVPEPPGSRTR